MKHLLTLILLTLSMTATAQWEKLYHPADELLKTNAYYSYSYTNPSVGAIVYWSSSPFFRIQTFNGSFDFDSKHREQLAVVGLYDENDRLVKRYDLRLTVKEGAQMAEANGRGKCTKIIDFLENRKGYVRIVASIYANVSRFDLRIPCIEGRPLPLTTNHR